MEGTTVGHQSILPAQEGLSLCPEDSGISPVWEAPETLWAACSGLGHCTGKKFFLMFSWNFLPIASCLIVELQRVEPCPPSVLSLQTHFTASLSAKQGKEHTQFWEGWLVRKECLCCGCVYVLGCELSRLPAVSFLASYQGAQQ